MQLGGGQRKYYRCKNCKKKKLFKTCGTWLQKHYAKYHPGMQLSVKEVFV